MAGLPPLSEILEEYQLVDVEDRYRLLIDLGRQLEPMPDALKTDATKVRGCSASVWVYPTSSEGRLHFLADSNAAITKGIVALVLSAVQDHGPEEGLDAALRCNRRRSFHRRATEGLQLGQKNFGEFPVEAPRTGLGHCISSAKRERRDGLLGAIVRDGRNDHDLRTRSGSDDTRNGFKPSGTGHFEIEHDDVDAAFAKCLDGVLGGSRDRRNLEGLVALDHAGTVQGTWCIRFNSLGPGSSL